MPFGDEETVFITLQYQQRDEVVVREAIGNIRELKSTTDKASDAIVRQNTEHVKNADVLRKVGHEIRTFRRDLFLLFFVFETIPRILQNISKFSESFRVMIDDMKSRMQETTTRAVQFWAEVFGVNTARLSSQTLQELKTFNARILAAQGDTLGALRERHFAEIAKLQQQIMVGDTSASIRLSGLMRAQAAEMAAAQRGIFGISTEQQTADRVTRGIADAVSQGISDPLFKFLQGEHQGFKDIIKSFQTTINRTIADTIGEIIKNKIFGAFSLKEFANDIRNNFRALQQTIKELGCNGALCRIAGNTSQTAVNTSVIAAARGFGLGGFSGLTAEIIAAGSSGLDKIGAISGAIAGVGGFFAGGGGKISRGGGASKHSGGWVPSFQTGGEVPIMAQPGEFIVKRSVAQQNRELLQGMNAGMRTGRGTNVFLIKANDAASFDAMLASPAAQKRIEIQLIKAIMTNSDARRIIKEFAR